MEEDQLRLERVRRHFLRIPEFAIEDSGRPLFEEGFAVYVIPVSLLGAIDALDLEVAVAVLMAYGPAGELRRAFLAGCRDYLREPWGPEELEWRLRLAAGRPAASLSSPWGTLTVGSDGAIGEAAEPVVLSYHERRVLGVLLRHRGEPVSREALFYALRGAPGAAASRAVDMHVSALRRKLAAAFPAREGRIRSVRGVGYQID